MTQKTRTRRWCTLLVCVACAFVGVPPTSAQSVTDLIQDTVSTPRDTGGADAAPNNAGTDTETNPARPPSSGSTDAGDAGESGDFSFAPDGDLDLSEDLKNLNFGKLAADIWHFRVFTTGGETITVGKIVIAILVLLVGLWIAKRLARIARGRLGKVKRIDLNAAALLSRLLYYLLAVVVAFVALDIAGIPLTIFTVLGGAVAIGIGFGIQTLFNNLISSLIIMVERPIRLGDIVIVDEHEGKIEEIGNRCTRLRRSDGIDVLIPNSYFLEQPVTNWTLLDNDVRGKVAVGVAYGSDTELVRKLIMEATKEHKRIKDTPEPVVLFLEFGDNALHFEVWFWVTVFRPIELRTVESDLRFRIDALCREHEVVIAFPQRDVHLDTMSPLEVRVVEKPAND